MRNKSLIFWFSFRVQEVHAHVRRCCYIIQGRNKIQKGMLHTSKTMFACFWNILGSGFEKILSSMIICCCNNLRKIICINCILNSFICKVYIKYLENSKKLKNSKTATATTSEQRKNRLERFETETGTTWF
jgi:hypothetical protein